MRFMESIGGSSYVIYLYHSLFVAAVMLGAGARLAIPTGLLFVVGGVAGIVGPMLMERGAREMPGGPLLLEGRMTPAVETSTNRPALSRELLRYRTNRS